MGTLGALCLYSFGMAAGCLLSLTLSSLRGELCLTGIFCDCNVCVAPLSFFEVVEAFWGILSPVGLLLCFISEVYEPRSKKTGLQGIRPGPTQTRLYGYRRWLEA